MANKKLEKLAEARGKPVEWFVDWVIVPEVNIKGQAKAARELGVSQASISGWLKDYGYVSRKFWQKDATPEEKRQIKTISLRYLKQEELS